MVVIKLLALALFVAVGATHIDTANYTPFAPNGFRGIHQGAAIVFFAYIGFDAISTAAEETRESAAQPADRHPRRPGDLHGHLRHRRLRADRHGAVPGARGRRSAGARARARRVHRPSSWIVALGAVVSMSAVLLVFQYGQPRIFFAMARDGLLPQWAAQAPPEVPHVPSTTTIITGVFVALVVAGRRRRRDLRPDQHRHAVRVHRSSASACSCCATRSPSGRGRSACRSSGRCACCRRAGCLFIMYGLPRAAWERFGCWLVIGLVLYFSYGFRHSKLRAARTSSTVLTRSPRSGRSVDGVRVLDLTRLLPGAYATLLLVDLGAEVIKIEDPRGGDTMRTLRGGPSRYFEPLNRGKRSVTLDLRSPDAAAVLDALIARADVLVESFRPSTARRLGVDARDAARAAPAADLRLDQRLRPERPVRRARRARHQLPGARRPAAAAGTARSAGRRHRLGASGGAGDRRRAGRAGAHRRRQRDRHLDSRSGARLVDVSDHRRSRAGALQRLRNRRRTVARAGRARAEVLDRILRAPRTCR